MLGSCILSASSSFIFNVLLNNIKKFGVREWSGCELKETLNSFVSKESVMIGIYIYIYIFLICFCFWIFSSLHPMCLVHAFLVASSSFIFNILLNKKYLIIKSDFVCLILRCFTLTIFVEHLCQSHKSSGFNKIWRCL